MLVYRMNLNDCYMYASTFIVVTWRAVSNAEISVQTTLIIITCFLYKKQHDYATGNSVFSPSLKI